MAYSLGVDVGTTFTTAAIARDGVIEVVSLGSHQVTEPTVVFADGKELVFGNAALLRGRSQPAGLAREFKRRLGDSVPLVLSGSPYSADRLVAVFAKWVVDTVSDQIGERPQRVVMTHPANWTEFQLHLLTQSFDEVGLGSALFLSEPEAAAIDYANVAQVRPGEIYAVYDLGGGTFDIALLRKEEEGFTQIGEAAGLERLGGIDFDEAVFRYVIDRLPADLVQSIRTDPDAGRALGQLRRACVETKEGLSSEVAVDIPVVLPELSTTVRLTRAEFEDMIRPSLDQSIELVRRTLDRAGVRAPDISGILLVGGSSRIPRVAELVQEELGITTRIDAHPKLVVARGAARWSASATPRVTPRAPSDDAEEQKSKRTRVLIAAGALAAVLIVVGVALAASGGDSPEQTSPTDPSSPASSPDTSPVTSPATSPDTSPISSPPDDSTDTVLVPSEPLIGHTGIVGTVAWSPDSATIASGGADTTVRVWNPTTGLEIGESICDHTDAVYEMAWSVVGTRLASGGNDRTVCVWDSTTGESIQFETGGVIFDLSWSPDGTKIVTTEGNSLQVWNVADGTAIDLPFEGHTKLVDSVSWSPDGSKIASGSDDGTVRVWNAATGVQDGDTLNGHFGGVYSVLWSPDGTRIASSGVEALWVWDPDDVAASTRFNLGAGNVGDLAWSPDGDMIAFGHLLGDFGDTDAVPTVRVVDAATGDPVGEPFTGHTAVVYSVAWSPDGTRIASSSEDETIRLWAAPTR